MDIKGDRSVSRIRGCLCVFVAVACVQLPRVIDAQALTGALIGTVRDEQGGVLAGAWVTVSSPALIGGPSRLTTNEKGQLRFPALPPALYVLEIEYKGFTTFHEEGIRIASKVGSYDSAMARASSLSGAPV